MISCTKRIEFDAAHRIVGHSGGCQMVHGHRYAVELTFSSKEVDPMGMIIDFKEIKARFKGWIDTHWDHNIILNKEDKTLGDMIQSYTGQKVFYLDYNPTSENIAFYLFDVVLKEVFEDLPHYVSLCNCIRVFETPTSNSAYNS
jgi:6-pyruvoyltetrahydropterin/6-carboxytetrahydropterin synthase